MRWIMEDETIVPLRPGFDNEFRGFNRKQVLEHLELLEDQIRILITDRDEAIRLNQDQRRITDETRRQMEETATELKRVQSSETGLPYATGRMQHILNMADEEATAIREHAKREAETVRGIAENDAEQIRSEAEKRAAELRQECAELVDELEKRRERIDEEHSRRAAELESERQELGNQYRETYQEAMAAAQRDADELMRQTRERCSELENDAHTRHDDVMSELRARARQLAEFRTNVLSTLDAMAEFTESHRTALGGQPDPADTVETRISRGEDAQGVEAATAVSTGEDSPNAQLDPETKPSIPAQQAHSANESGRGGPIPLDPVGSDEPTDDEVPVLNRSGSTGESTKQSLSAEYGY